MSRYYVQTTRKGVHDNPMQKQAPSSQRESIVICDRRQEGDQTLIKFRRASDLDLADRVCEFLNNK